MRDASFPFFPLLGNCGAQVDARTHAHARKGCGARIRHSANMAADLDESSPAKDSTICSYNYRLI
eukprot:8394920-Pyramimonas_sp.AAC.1